MSDPEDRSHAEAEVELQERERELLRERQDLERKQRDAADLEEALASRSESLVRQQGWIEEQDRKFREGLEALAAEKAGAVDSLERTRGTLREATLLVQQYAKTIREDDAEIARLRTALVDQTKEAVANYRQAVDAQATILEARTRLRDAKEVAQGAMKRCLDLQEALARERQSIRELTGSIRELRSVNSSDAVRIKNLEERLLLANAKLKEADQIIAGLRGRRR